MKMKPQEWIDLYFDEGLNPSEMERLSDWIKSDPEHAKVFVQVSMLHDRLRDTLVDGVGVLNHGARVESHTPSIGWMQSLTVASRWSAAASVAILILGLGFLWFGFSQSTASAAYRELDRIIEQNIRSRDRTYEIVVESISSPSKRTRRASGPEKDRPTKPPLDGASLYVRDPHRFVLIRTTEDGLPFITGSNGEQSWAVNARGPVRVSGDIHRFDRDLPGHESSIPLTNLNDGLEKLRRSYQVQLSNLGPEEYAVQEGELARLLLAVKKPKERGPQRVEITYEAHSGRILHMRFIQMPYGPDRLDLRLNLVEEGDMPADFYEHKHHHTNDRKIEYEN